MGLLKTSTLREEIPQVRIHANAKLTPRTRRLLVDRIREAGWSVTRAARAAGVTRGTAYKWLRRFEEEGIEGLQDRSSRPHSIARKTPRAALRRIEQLRRRRKAGWEIALETGIPVSTVSRQLKQLGLGERVKIRRVLNQLLFE